MSAEPRAVQPHMRGRADRATTERKFRAARRHSAWIRLLRVVVPVGIVLILGGIAGVTYLNPLRMLARLPIDPGQIAISGTKVTMSAPRLSGYTRDARAYDLTARAASQDLANPNLLELEDIRARIAMEDKSEVQMRAATGIYDRKTEQMTLSDKILLTSSSGYEARLTEAVIDVKSGKVTSRKPVEVKMLNGTLSANALTVDDKGEAVRFDGGVAMTLFFDDQPGTQKAPQ
jgi:lipopolysaccharide export system protein LptC